MPSRVLGESLLRRRAAGSSLPGSRAAFRERPQACRLLWPKDVCAEGCSRARLLLGWLFDIHQRIVGVHRLRRVIQQLERLLVFIGAENGGLRCGKDATDGVEGGIYGRSLVSAVHHTVRALGIAGFGAVLVPR